jgi:hypothetical protein
MDSRREEALYLKIIEAVNEIEQYKPLCRNTKIILGCSLFFLGIVLGYVNPVNTSALETDKPSYVSFYSPYYKVLANIEVKYGNK